jgi:hypothetical protein
MRPASLVLIVAACAPRAAPARHASPTSTVASVSPAPVFVPDLVQRRVESDRLRVDAPVCVGHQELCFAPEVILYADLASMRDPQPPLPGPLPPPLLGAAPAIVTVAYCIDEIGRVTSARPLPHDAGVGDLPRNSPIAGEPRDVQLAVSKVKGWRFAPYFVDGHPVKACSHVDVKTGVSHVVNLTFEP